MTEIKPLSSENDLRIAADGITVHSVIEQPIIRAPLPPAPRSLTPNQTHGFDVSPSAARIESQVLNSKINSAENSEKPFAYRLPVFSYVLAWFYIVATIITLTMLVSSSIAYDNSNSIYSSIKSAPYLEVFLPFYIILVYFIVMSIFLLSARRIMRYLGIIFSIGIIIYVGYEFVVQFGPSLFGSYSFNSLIDSMMYLYFLMIYSAYLPYVLLPIVSIVYLFTPKAARAYK